MSVEERKAMEKSLLSECKTKEGASDADVTAAMAREMPATKPAKCMHACMVETIGLVKNGKPSAEGAIELAKTAFEGNERAMNFVKEVSNECGAVEDADRCELALKMMICGKGVMTKLGINPNDVF